MSQTVDALGFHLFAGERLNRCGGATGMFTFGKKSQLGFFPDSCQRGGDGFASTEYLFKQWSHFKLFFQIDKLFFDSTREHLADGRQLRNAIADDFDGNQERDRQ